jgi:non-ribosomal peptide synthetase component F
MEFADLLAQVKAATTAAFEHQDYPFDLLIEALNPGRAGNQQPLLNVIYAFQNFQDVAIDIGARETAGRAAAAIAADTVAPAISAFPVPFETSKFDLTLFVTDEGGQLLLSLEYDTNLFRRDTIGRCLSALDRFAGMVE